MLGLLYGLLSYLVFLAVFAYFALFTDGVFVPKSVDGGALTPASTALLVDAGLMLLFGLQHSVMARASFKRALTRVIPEHLERSTFVLVSSATLALMMWQWRPITTTVWSVENPTLAAGLWGLNGLGWLGVPAVSYMIDHFELFGLKQPFQAFRRSSIERKGFVTPLLYKYMRHPMMTAFFVALWATPHMTLGHLLLAAGMSVYIVIGVHFEERSLARELGASYLRYQASTPMFLPLRAPQADTGEALGAPPSRNAV